MTDGYDDIHARSLREPEAFWAEAAEAVDWDRRWDKREGGQWPSLAAIRACLPERGPSHGRHFR